ncbi:hypothetical protein INR49_007327 [Caranx melampygus]|nr:hypothetical protein INR49_007327 [Caranx melampygus]
MGKPAPLNTFLSMKPQNMSESPVFSEGLTKALNAHSAVLEANKLQLVGQSAPLKLIPPPGVSKPGPLEAKAPLPVSKPAPYQVQLAPPKPEPLQAKPPLSLPNSAPPVSKPASVEVKPVQSEAKPAASESKPALPAAKPVPPAMIKIVSDVAAPGVPESEQTRTVFVKPPPFMNMSEGGQRSEKLKSNLAAAKAQELFGIFYSSATQSGPSSFTKPPTDSRAEANKTTLTPPQAPKPQSEPPTQTQPQPPVHVHTAPQPQPDSNRSPSVPQSQPEIQISSVWSLQSTPAPTPEKTSPAAQPELTPRDQSAPPSGPQNQTLNSKAELHVTPQSDPEPTPRSQSQSTLPPQTRTELQSKPGPDLDTQSHADSAPEPKPGPKTRGRRASPAAHPIRQTRSQTRYQTRRQQQQQNQSEPESDPTSGGDSESAASDTKGLDTSDPGSGSQPEEGASSTRGSQDTEITPETLGLPSDMTSLDFDLVVRPGFLDLQVWTLIKVRLSAADVKLEHGPMKSLGGFRAAVVFTCSLNEICTTFSPCVVLETLI